MTKSVVNVRVEFGWSAAGAIITVRTYNHIVHNNYTLHNGRESRRCDIIGSAIIGAPKARHPTGI